mgnify:FL=1
MKKTAGLIGFGVMGQAIAEKLIEKNYQIMVYDIDTAACSRAQKSGCLVFKSPALVAERVEVILISLPTPENVQSAVYEKKSGILSTAKAGSVIVDTSTVGPDTTIEAAHRAQKTGIGYIDAPVLGRPASVGNWTFPVGAVGADLEKVTPILCLLGEKIVHLGPPGSGNTLKLLNNLMFGAINSITCEVFALCKHLNMDPELFFDTISKSRAGTVSNLFRELGPKIVRDEFSPNFSVNNLYKDIQLGLDLAANAGARLPISENNQAFNALGKDTELGNKDTSVLVKIFEKLILIKD